MSEQNHDLKLALEEMRFNLQQSISAGDALDQKVNVILITAGLIMAVTTTLQISLSLDHSNLYWFILLVAVALYIFSVGAALLSSRPQAYHLAISADWEELDKHIFGRSERDAIMWLLSGYVDQVKYNGAINRYKAKLHKLSLVIMFITIVLLVVLTAIQ